MKIRLVSHASVLIDSGDCVIWTDPWLSGKAFNNPWALLPEASFDPAELDRINYLWISHEHPDHFHIPTLRALPTSFKERVTVLYQKLNSEKMLAAFKQLGFRNIRLLPHGKLSPLTDRIAVYSYYVGIMDSCLGVKSAGGDTIFNANDAQIVPRDCAVIRKDLGPVATLLTQFSIAFYSGLPNPDDRLRRMAQGILQRISGNHRDLAVKRTIPFASFIYYCSEENRYINRHHNTPQMVHEYFAARGQNVAVLYPGDTFDDSRSHDSIPALERYDQLYAGSDRLPYDRPEQVQLTELQMAFRDYCAQLHDRYPSALLKLLRPVTVAIPDLDKTVSFSLGHRSFNGVASTNDADLTVSSQALHFCFANPYGFQTLGVSGRVRLREDTTNWRMHHLLFVLNNAEISLRPTRLLSARNLAFLRERSSGGMNLISYVGSRMRRISPLESTALPRSDAPSLPGGR